MIPLIGGALVAATMFMAPHVATAPVSVAAPAPVTQWVAKTGTLPVGQAAMFNDMRHAGMSRIQASGVMANVDHESGFNVENHAMDTNGFRGYGLLSWNSEFYPQAAGLVTGNVTKDLAAQVHFMLHGTDNNTKGLMGNSAWAVGGNWSQYVEVCVNCEPGGKQWHQRSAEAKFIHGEADATPAH